MSPARFAALGACLVAVLTVSCSFGPDPSGTLTGHVYKEGTALPIPGAFVRCEGLATTSDATGAYTIEGIVPGSCSVSSSADGYVDYSAGVRVGSLTVHDIFMTPFVPKARLHGVVSHWLEGPLEGAAVDLGGIVVHTDSIGHYEYPSIPQGTYHMSVTKQGFRAYSSASVHVLSDVVRHDVAMKKLATESFATDADAGLSSTFPTSNFGDAPTISLVNNQFFHWKFLIRFPLSLPATAEPVSAVLRVADTAPSEGEADPAILVARVLVPWEEMAVTWDDSLDTTGGTTATASYEEPWCEIGVTPQVASWVTGGQPNRGIEVDMAYATNAPLYSFASRENEDAGIRPLLVVEYAW